MMQNEFLKGNCNVLRQLFLSLEVIQPDIFAFCQVGGIYNIQNIFFRLNNKLNDTDARIFLFLTAFMCDKYFNENRRIRIIFIFTEQVSNIITIPLLFDTC